MSVFATFGQKLVNCKFFSMPGRLATNAGVCVRVYIYIYAHARYNVYRLSQCT